MPPKDREWKWKRVQESFFSHHGIMPVEKTNLSEERGKYIVICKKDKEQEVREFVDATCT